MTSGTTLSAALHGDHRERPVRVVRGAREVRVAEGTRLFEEGRRAELFRIVRTRTVGLDLRVPGRRSPVVETPGHGELVGWCWHFPPAADTTTGARCRSGSAACSRSGPGRR
ncbi:hypothetical protein SLITK23_04620 [Streptomyces lividans]|uniref:Regulator protein n=1 Tax=Streptomyces lividans 1326 TaxID=1200984 RepID=A0A7U9DJP7_STRLI|nr:hypothetical protein [Streptomyces sp. WM6391]EFD71443.1 hypothetical protein SSPG_07083 [Streptomyces lividans TK24]EOY45196.1 regulator protein [Streptomyces lividans 1326]KKD17260.1 hypothetical protein TR66_00080 [Streptomyces sp. WM6391]BDE37217.1 hypothetical protein SLITK23_04620 [Streptomyces lividans]